MSPAAPTRARPATVAVVGSTASGKSALAMALATAEPGWEIVCVDSMQVYRGMDIGTAKPTPAERAAVPHHLLDLADPGEEVSVVRFRQAADQALDAIAARGHRALLVGGTGLYLRALIDHLEPPPSFPAVLAQLDADPDTEALHGRLAALDPDAAARMLPTNRRRVLRALEVTVGSGRPFSSFGPGLTDYPDGAPPQVGLRWPRAVLTARIEQRFRAMLAGGLLDEVRALAERPRSRTAGQALGYKELLAHVEGRCSLDDAVQLAITRTRQLAVRQERWFRRDPRIRWVDIEADPLTALPVLREVAACA